jgi:MFS family permease
MMFSVPLYFQITARTSNAEAGAHLFPAVAGNCVGGLLSGVLIKRSGRYKVLCTFATICSSTCYLLLMLRWHGHTNWLESLYIVPGYGLPSPPLPPKHFLQHPQARRQHT